MIAFFLVGVGLWFGWVLTSLIPITWYKVERMASAIILGLLGSVWLYFLFSLVLPYCLSIPVSLAVQLGLCIWLTIVERKKLSNYIPYSSPWLAVLSIIGGGGMLHLLYTHM